eukprot:9272045-Alexandrium_andersonii.AAC.1
MGRPDKCLPRSELGCQIFRRSSRRPARARALAETTGSAMVAGNSKVWPLPTPPRRDRPGG